LFAVRYYCHGGVETIAAQAHSGGRDVFDATAAGTAGPQGPLPSSAERQLFVQLFCVDEGLPSDQAELRLADARECN
jgi:hypothetical protein